LQDVYNQALVLHQRGKLVEAEQLYRQVLAVDARMLAARQMLGVVLVQQGRLEEALAMMQSALALNPRHAGILVNAGNILNLMGRFAESLAHYDRALAIAPDADTWTNRGNTLQALFRTDEALASYEQALRFNPRDIQALFRRGAILGECGRATEALEAYDKVLALNPNHIEALNNRGYTRWSQTRWESSEDYARSIADLQRALQLAPDMPFLEGGVLHLKMQVADWSDFSAEKARLIEGVRAGLPVARPFMFQALSDSPADSQTCARTFAAAMHPPVADAAPAFARKAGGRIRLAYLSGEFREQATAILMAGLYERHDRETFEVIAVDNGSAGTDAMSRRLKSAFDEWIDIGGLSDQEASQKIRDAGIDILVNLNGWFGRPRMGVFALRAAPVQVNYLGFPGTLGAPYMDYIIADRVVIPEGEERFYEEAVVTLFDDSGAGCYQANDDRGRPMAPIPTRAEAGLPDTGFVFCNFNHVYKLTPETFSRWMCILKQVPGSVLWLLQGPPPLAQNIARHAQAHGVAPERILYAPHLPPEKHLARLSLADLFLDQLPYNAHTTGSDALWAGVPLLTQTGTTFPGRVAASLLLAAGLPELVTRSEQEFEALAVRLATDPQALGRIKSRLTRQCPLFDTDLFRRRIEAAYQRMWEAWQAGQKPAGFAL
jgi:predicted O-linked N-acetylglucosamine transferase (SPINDLY family)